MPNRTLLGFALLAAVVQSAACRSRAPAFVDTEPMMSTAPSVDSGAFIAMLGADTLWVERFTRTPMSLEGDIVVRTPATRVTHYSAELSPGGTIRNFNAAMRPAAALAAAPLQHATVVIAGDSARITTIAGGNTREAGVAVRPGAVPVLVIAYSLLEQGALQHRRSGADSTEIDLILAGGRQTMPVAYVRRGADSLTIYLRGSPILASVDQHGRLTGLDGIRTTQKIIARRVPSVDFERIVASFASRDEGGRALGPLSPRDTVTAAVGSANISIDYSRPSRRGRQIFGSVVPWNQVWRTGANAATTMTTTGNLTIGGAPVPAGTYTIFTLPAEQGTQLIINSQTGQWGTVYDPARDVARVPMTRENLSSPVEQFTIDIVPSAGGAQLQLSWDRMRFTAPISAP